MVVLALAVTVLLGGPTPAHAGGDPSLSIDRAAALSALHCPTAFTRPKAPALLVHGTGSTAEESWAHTFAQTLPLDGHDVCTTDLPPRALPHAPAAAAYVAV